MAIEEKDGQFESRFDGEDMRFFDMDGEEPLHIGTISLSEARVTYARAGYEKVVNARLAPIRSIRSSLGIK